ncbi:group II truncated hemoglobin [Saccharomonospora sp. NPDC006951]
MAGREALFEAIGGMSVLRALSDTFYSLALKDPILSPVFADFSPQHREHVAVWLAEVFGGLADYTTNLGGHQSLLKVHQGLSITEEQRKRWLELMSVSVEKELPPHQELHHRVMSYFEWGTAIAKDVSQEPRGTKMGEPGPTPRWDWD